MVAGESEISEGAETPAARPRIWQQRGAPPPPAATADAPLEALLGDDAPLCGALRARRLQLVKDLVYVPAYELRDWLLVTEDRAEALLAKSWAACAAQATTAWDLAAIRSPAVASRAPTPLPSLTEALGGGIAGVFMEVAGPPGAGKTQFCLHLAALTAAQGGDVFWIDTERTFSPQRLLELLEAVCGIGPAAEERAFQALQRVRRRLCTSLQELSGIVEELAHCASRHEALPALLIIDSVASVARNEGGDPLTATSRRDSIPKRQAALNTLASHLKAIAATPVAVGVVQRPAVVVTNQVAGDPISGGCRVALGNVWHHAVNWRLVLSRGNPGVELQANVAAPSDERWLFVEKSPCSGPLSIPFVVAGAGLQEKPAVAMGAM
mmetsp:Transcript_3696/g.9578  ORF Transcript_3696/g.9578 Transcript_3696/m.9578 type:complete len:382 (+) Transcript_3696:101-1246(+)